MLEQMGGLEVVGEAASGQEVLTQARELVPDVILMDIRMPGMTGIEATRSIRQENPHIGVILVTMFDDPESVFSGMREVQNSSCGTNGQSPTLPQSGKTEAHTGHQAALSST